MELSEEGIQVRRRVRRLDSGLVRLDQEIRVSGTHPGIDVSGPYWIFGMVRVEKGTILYRRDHEKLDVPGSSYAMFLPPYSLVEVELCGSHSSSQGLVSREPPPDGLPETPVVFVPANRDCPSTLQELSRLVSQSRGFVDVRRVQNPPPLARRVKAMLDHEYRESGRISDLATRVGTSTAVVSRYFKLTYGMPPVRYRHHLRITEAMMRLTEGRAVTDVFQEVGFDDLSAFYRRFRERMIGPPNEYRPITTKVKKRQDTW